MSQEVALNKLEKGPLMKLLAIMLLEKKMFRDFAVLTDFWPKCDLERKVKSQA
jgi:hypothetical protein